MDDLVNIVSTVGDRFANNVKGSIVNMSYEKWIRLVIVAGAYMLLRPYIIKLGGRVQMSAHEREAAESEEAYQKAQISPNQLRGQVDIAEDSDDEDDVPTISASGADWGKKARRRQRTVIKKLLDAEEKRLQETLEEEEDKDIEEFLTG
ncbi:protein trafficking Pga2 [Podospora didyma]|uniref:Protein trafficking Pga2 n=1 Tax=Podospora didyma TaxID=330526 RepID=A0AAE0KLH3_9PEZI|nr:protein trafficking Pga2 [Podospora didyma]